MATTSIWRVKGYISKVLLYAQNPDKTTNPEVIQVPQNAEGRNGCMSAKLYLLHRGKIAKFKGIILNFLHKNRFRMLQFRRKRAHEALFRPGFTIQQDNAGLVALKTLFRKSVHNKNTH